MSRETLDCLQRQRDICVKNVIPGQNTAFMFTPALKPESNGLQVDRNHKFSERNFQPLQYSRQHPRFSAHWAGLMTKTDSTFPAFSSRIVDFAVQFLLHCKFSFHEKQRSSQVWQWRDLPKPITILCQRRATNGIASFCIDHRWRQMAFFVFF